MPTLIYTLVVEKDLTALSLDNPFIHNFKNKIWVDFIDLSDINTSDVFMQICS